MLARSLYSHDELIGKPREELMDLCWQKGQNWNDLATPKKRGYAVYRLINYDIHWNPVRLIQRFGRIRPQRRLEMRINEMYFKIKSCLSIGIQLGQC